MPDITVSERLISRATKADDDTSSIETLWSIEGSDDELAVREKLGQESPEWYWDRLTERLLIRKDHSVKPIGHELWDGVVNYSPRDSRDKKTPTFSFDTTGGTTHVTQSLGTRSYTNTSAPDFKGAIGVIDKDQIEGVDIVLPALKFSETHPVKAKKVTPEFVALLAAMTGRTNQYAWRRFDPETVLFKGASGQSQEDADEGHIVPVTFNFEVQSTNTLEIGGITGILKKGWEYLWVFYDEEEDEDAKLLVRRPRAVYVEKIYPLADFSLLGID